jgi:hypothetical protein
MFAQADQLRPGLYARGHLLGAHLFGPGDATNGTWNLAPITEAANRAMTRVENQIHELIFTRNKVVAFKVAVTYPDSPTVPANAPSPIEYFLPTRIVYEVKTLRLTAQPQTATPAAVNAARLIAANWIPDESVSVPPIDSTPPKDQPLNVQTLNTFSPESLRERGVSKDYAEAIVSLRGQRHFVNKQDFLMRMQNAAATGIMVLASATGVRYNPRQTTIDTYTAVLDAALTDDLRWK